MLQANCPKISWRIKDGGEWKKQCNVWMSYRSWCCQGTRIIAMPKMQYLDWTNPNFNEQMYPNLLVPKIQEKECCTSQIYRDATVDLPGHHYPPPFRIEACPSPDAGRVGQFCHTVVPSSDYPLLRDLLVQDDIPFSAVICVPSLDAMGLSRSSHHDLTRDNSRSCLSSRTN